MHKMISISYEIIKCLSYINQYCIVYVYFLQLVLFTPQLLHALRFRHFTHLFIKVFRGGFPFSVQKLPS